MKNQHPIANEVLDLAAMALSKAERWMVYNDASYSLEKEDVRFFKTTDDAVEFTINAYGIGHQYEVISFRSLEDILRQIPYDTEARQTPFNLDALTVGREDPFIEGALDRMAQQQYSLLESTLNTDFMKQENFDFLADNIKYAGFGEDLKPSLEKAMREGNPEF